MNLAPVVVIILYLVVVACIGSVAFRRGKENTEDFFLASRTIGPMVFRKRWLLLPKSLVRNLSKLISDK